MNSPAKVITWLCLTIVALVALMSCNTGIEGTKTIKMSRSEKRDARPGAEELAAAAITSEPLSAWAEGKPFYIADNKASMLMDYTPDFSENSVDSPAGRVIRYHGMSTRPTPGGGARAIIVFRDSTGSFAYDTQKDPERAYALTGLDLPALIDLEMVTAADSLFRGRKVWTLSSLWYDSDGNAVKGRKFVPVTISGIVPGNMIFPLRAEFVDDSGSTFSMYMNVNAAKGLGAESRTFSQLFSFTDPKLKYPSISDDNWQLICNSRVALGMTKEECRLALGNPAEVDAGHNWSSVIDVWGYKDGTYLQFQDGLLINFRN